MIRLDRRASRCRNSSPVLLIVSTASGAGQIPPRLLSTEVHKQTASEHKSSGYLSRHWECHIAQTGRP